MTPRFYRKVIRIRGADSPNVRRGIWLQAQGLEPDDRVVVPGVLTWSEYRKRLATWDKVRICVGIDGEFYEGAEVLLFPPEWLNHSEKLHDDIVARRLHRKALSIGIDPGEGVAETCMCAVDRMGVVELVARPTPDTSVIRREALAFMNRHGVPPERVHLDRGGGGKQIADELRAQGHPVKTVGFGESVQLPVKKGQHFARDRREVKEEAYEYKNRRAQLYGELSRRLDPVGSCGGFAVPALDRELRRQLAPLPKLFDEEGRLYLPPKQKRDDRDTRKTLTEILGCSPDRADALALAVYGLYTRDVPRNVEVM